MEQICPVCNGLTSLSLRCPDCGKNMEDLGQAGDYFGPYSPYEENRQGNYISYEGEYGVGACVHILKCFHCCCYRQYFVCKMNL